MTMPQPTAADANDPLIKVMLEDGDGGGIVEFRASEVLRHNSLQCTWDDVGKDRFEQTSLAEDFALWSAKRKYGDMSDYHVEVISLGEEAVLNDAGPGV